MKTGFFRRFILFCFLGLAWPAQAANTSIDCRELLGTSVASIKWKDIENVEVHFDYYMNSGEWVQGWKRSSDGSQDLGRGFLRGQKVFFKKLDKEQPNELAL